MKNRMISKHRTNKKANQHKLRVINEAKRILDKHSICKIYAPNPDQIKDSLVFKEGTPCKLTHSLAWHFDNVRMYWDVVCGVILRDQKGIHYLRYISFQAKEECLSYDVSELAQKACALLYAKAPKLERLCPFWIASPKREFQEISVPEINLVLKTAESCKALDRMFTHFEEMANIPIRNHHTGSWYNIEFDYDKCIELELDLAEIDSVELKKVEVDGKISRIEIVQNNEQIDSFPLN